MTDITGFYEFHRDCPAIELVISAVNAETGALEAATLAGTPIQGTYNPSTNAISFDHPPAPPFGVLFVPFFSGFAISGGDDRACALAGTFHETVIELDPLSVRVIEAAWYAVYQGPVIQ